MKLFLEYLIVVGFGVMGVEFVFVYMNFGVKVMFVFSWD